MEHSDVDTELYAMLLRFVQLTSELDEEGTSPEEIKEILRERRDLSKKLRGRGFMITDEQLREMEN